MILFDKSGHFLPKMAVLQNAGGSIRSKVRKRKLTEGAFSWKKNDVTSPPDGWASDVTKSKNRKKKKKKRLFFGVIWPVLGIAGPVEPGSLTLSWSRRGLPPHNIWRHRSPWARLEWRHKFRKKCKKKKKKKGTFQSWITFLSFE